MRPPRITSLLVSATIFLGADVHAQRPEASSQPGSEALRFEHFSVEDGLSDLRVTSIWQDREGFMWFGTLDGLNRYDGYTFTVYRHDPLDSTSLSSSYIEEIIEDGQGNFWIGTVDAGLNRYDPWTDSFVRYRHDPHDSTSLCSDWVASLYETSDGRIWVGGGELSRYDRTTDSFHCFRPDPSDATSLSASVGFAIYEDRHGVLWVGTGGFTDAPDVGGLNRFDQVTQTFTSYKHDPFERAYHKLEEAHGDLETAHQALEESMRHLKETQEAARSSAKACLARRAHFRHRARDQESAQLRE